MRKWGSFHLLISLSLWVFESYHHGDTSAKMIGARQARKRLKGVKWPQSIIWPIKTRAQFSHMETQMLSFQPPVLVLLTLDMERPLSVLQVFLQLGNGQPLIHQHGFKRFVSGSLQGQNSGFTLLKASNRARSRSCGEEASRSVSSDHLQLTTHTERTRSTTFAHETLLSSLMSTVHSVYREARCVLLEGSRSGFLEKKKMIFFFYDLNWHLKKNKYIFECVGKRENMATWTFSIWLSWMVSDSLLKVSLPQLLF